MQRHSGSDQPKHTGAVLGFAMAARLRGWEVEVLPKVANPLLFPDAMIVNGLGQRTYVEVELGSQKTAKWKNYREYQRRVALCAKTKRGRQTLVKECKALGLPGIATDLLHLARNRDASSQLWIQRWDEKG